MKKEDIKHFIRDLHPVTKNSVRAEFFDQPFDVGFFTSHTEEINQENKWRFKPNNSSSFYHLNSPDGKTIIIDGNTIKSLRLG